MRNKVVLISGRQIQAKWKNKLFELFCGPILNYDRNDDKHVYKNNNHDDYDIDHYATSHDYYNNFNNDSKSSKIEKKDRGTSLKCGRFISNASFRLCIPSE